MKRGQSTLDYVLLIGIAAAGLIAMLAYISRGMQGNVRNQAEKLSSWQYAPGKTTINNKETKTATASSDSGSWTPITIGNLNAQNKALEDKYDEIEKLLKELAVLEKSWEDTVVPEAEAGAKAVRDGDLDWTRPMNPAEGLDKIEVNRKKANDDLAIKYKEAKDLEDAWKKRHLVGDVTGETESYSKEHGDTTDTKEIHEVLDYF